MLAPGAAPRAGRGMSCILFAFMGVYPYLVWPWGMDVNIPLARSEWLILFTVLLWVVFINMFYRGKYRPPLLAANWFFLGFICLATLSAVLSEHLTLSVMGEYRRYEGLAAWYSYMTLFMFGFWFIEEGSISRFLKVFLAGGFISSVYGILQHFKLEFLPRASYAVKRTRSFAFFSNANFFGAYLILIVMVGSIFFLIEKKTKLMMVWAFITAVSFSALVYTETLGAWLGLVCALGTFALLARKEIPWTRYIALLLIFAVVFALVTLEGGRHLSRVVTLGKEVKKAVEGEDGAVSGRGYVWNRSLPLVRKYLWLGSGPDTFGKVFPQNERLYWDKAHSEPLQIAITMGIPALIFYLLGLGAVLAKGYRARWDAAGKDSLILSGLVAACLGYQAHGLINISTIGVAPFFWLILGITYKLSLRGKVSTYRPD